MPSLLLSNGGAHSPHIACMAGNVTPYKEVREGRGKERGGGGEEEGKKEIKDESSNHHPFSMHTKPTFSQCMVGVHSGLHWQEHLRCAGSLCVQCGRSGGGKRCV